MPTLCLVRCPRKQLRSSPKEERRRCKWSSDVFVTYGGYAQYAYTMITQ